MTRDPLHQASLIFDLDGTLVDTAPDLVRALNAVIEPDGLAPANVETVRHMVGHGARRLIVRAFADQARPLDDARLETLVADFIERYRADIDGASRPFDSVGPTLDTLASRGARLSVATNKPQALADLLLARLGLADRFDRIVGADAAPSKKPDPAHIRAAAGPDADRMLVVGDSAVDVAAARAAGAPVIVMRYGYTDTPSDQLGADRVLDRFGDLPEAIETLLTR